MIFMLHASGGSPLWGPTIALPMHVRVTIVNAKHARSDAAQNGRPRSSSRDDYG